MNQTNRRAFLKQAGVATIASVMPNLSKAAVTPPRVVVIGGGFGGATVSKYLRLWGGETSVTMVESQPLHYSCILSNGVVTGDYGLDRVTLNYDALQYRHGVEWVQGKAVRIDPDSHRVTVKTANGRTKLSYDKLVVSPGVDFVTPLGNYKSAKTPHAWKAGSQTINLQRKLRRMRNGGTFVMRIPKAPYRCPPGPYERACVVADFLKRNNPGSKVIVLDENPKIMAEPVTFGNAFDNLYSDILEYHTNVQVAEIDSSAGILSTNLGPIVGDVINFIPDHKAGKLLRKAGLVDDPTGRWAQVDPITYNSISYPDIHIIGDSQATGQPKSGHMANAQAKVCADAILRYFDGEAPNQQPSTASACFSPVTKDTAGWLTAVFQYDAGSGQMKVVPESFAEAEKVSKDNYEEMFAWADNLFADSFG